MATGEQHIEGFEVPAIIGLILTAQARPRTPALAFKSGLEKRTRPATSNPL